jgi:hypothetical protein
VRASVRALAPRLVVLVATDAALLAAHADELRELAAATPMAIGGVGDATVLERLGATALPADIVDAARSLVL